MKKKLKKRIKALEFRIGLLARTVSQMKWGFDIKPIKGELTVEMMDRLYQKCTDDIGTEMNPATGQIMWKEK